MPVHLLDWDDAVQSVVDIVNGHVDLWRQFLGSSPILLLRDWKGRINICLPGREDGVSGQDLQNELSKIGDALGVLGPQPGPGAVLFADDLFDPNSIFDSPDKVRIQETPIPIFLLDRQDKEADWLRPRLADSFGHVPRATFFGVKGGVGRSTALIGLALSLGKLGKKVLVIDTDFESPGLSSSLVAADARPDYGLVDWFAADAIDPGAADELLGIGGIVEASPLNKLISGRILVAPTFGDKSQAYVSKLGRVYATSDDSGTYAERLSRVISKLETEHSPDVTLIDSRAGIDDTSATAITRLGARAFLFAVNTTQTWDAYSLLFKHLQRHPSIHTDHDFRNEIQMVSALTPDPAVASGYFESMRENAYELFQSLYDEIAPGEDGLNAFNFDFDDKEAPHNLWRVRWDDALRAFDPIKFEEHMSADLQAKVFGEFTTNATEWLLGAQK